MKLLIILIFSFFMNSIYACDIKVNLTYKLPSEKYAETYTLCNNNFEFQTFRSHKKTLVLDKVKIVRKKDQLEKIINSFKKDLTLRGQCKKEVTIIFTQKDKVKTNACVNTDNLSLLDLNEFLSLMRNQK